MSIAWDTAGAIQAIDALSVEKCSDSCWCSGRPSTQGSTLARYTWIAGDPIVRFGPDEEAA